MAPQVVSKIAVSTDRAEFMRRALACDDTAFRTIMERHNGRLYWIARSISRNDSEAGDAAPDLDRFRGESSLATWQPTQEIRDLTQGIASGKLPGGSRLNWLRPARERPSLRTMSECGHLDEVPGASSREFASADGCAAHKRRRS
jgi:hypothetical protein